MVEASPFSLAILLAHHDRLSPDLHGLRPRAAPLSSMAARPGHVKPYERISSLPIPPRRACLRDSLTL